MWKDLCCLWLMPDFVSARLILFRLSCVVEIKLSALLISLITQSNTRTQYCKKESSEGTRAGRVFLGLPMRITIRFFTATKSASLSLSASNCVRSLIHKHRWNVNCWVLMIVRLFLCLPPAIIYLMVGGAFVIDFFQKWAPYILSVHLVRQESVLKFYHVKIMKLCSRITNSFQWRYEVTLWSSLR